MPCLHQIFCLPCSCAVNSNERECYPSTDYTPCANVFIIVTPPEKTQDKLWDDSTSSIHDTEKKAVREPSIFSATTTLHGEEEKGVEYKDRICRVGTRTDDHRLYQAAAGGNLQDVKKLLASGFNPSDCTIFDWCPLHWAAHNDLVHGREIVKLLIEHGADVNQVSDTGLTPLDLARRANRSENVQLLEEAGAKTGAQIRLRMIKSLQANPANPWPMQ